MSTRGKWNMKILLLSLSANPGSLSRRAAGEFRRMLEASSVANDWIDIRSLPPVWVDGRDLNEYPEEYRKLSEAVAAASGVVIFHADLLLHGEQVQRRPFLR